MARLMNSLITYNNSQFSYYKSIKDTKLEKYHKKILFRKNKNLKIEYGIIATFESIIKNIKYNFIYTY